MDEKRYRRPAQYMDIDKRGSIIRKKTELMRGNQRESSIVRAAEQKIREIELESRSESKKENANTLK